MPDMKSLSFDISADASKAAEGLDALVGSLENLKTASSSGTAKLNSLAGSVSSLATSLGSMGGVKASSIASISQSLSTLKGISISKATATNLANLAVALKTLGVGTVTSAAMNLNSVSTALQGLKGTSSSLGTLFKRLAELPALVKSLEAVDLDRFTQQIGRLAVALTPLATKMATVGTGFSNLARNVTTTTTRINASNTSVKAYTSSIMGLGSGLGSAIAKLSMFALGFHVVKGLFTKAITLSNEYQENLNLFTVAMGGSALEAQNFAEKVSEAVGIDPAEWMRNQGVFNTLLTGFGVVSEKASVMSQNLTQLGYDLASFYNLSTEDALTKIQSGISGELEPLRRLGYDLSVARLQQEAYNLGINESVNSMTQAEKAQLRYHAIMTQVTEAQGDMARTINAPANQLRVLKAQVTMAARAFGNIFIPILNAVLPLLIAVAKAARMVASSIASLFGFKLTEVDYSTVNSSAVSAADSTDALADSTDGATKSAKKATKAYKKFTKQLMSFDRINNLTTKDKSSSGGSGSGGSSGIGGGTGGGFDLDPISYDFLAGLEDYLDGKTSKIQKFGKWVSKHIKGVLSLVAAAVGGFLAVLGYTKIMQFSSAMKELLGAPWLQKFAGIFMIAAGAILYVLGAIDALKNGLTTGNLIQMLAGLGIAVGGLALVAGPIAAAIGGIVGAVGLIVTAIVDMKKNGLNKKNIVALAAGIAILGGAIALITGGPIALIIGLAVAAFTGLVLIIVKYRKKILKKIKNFFGPFAEKAKEVFGGLKDKAKAGLTKLGKFLTKKRFKGLSLKDLIIGATPIGAFAKAIKKLLKKGLKKTKPTELIKTAIKAWFKGVTFPISLAFNIGEKVADVIGDVTGIDIKATFGGWAEGAQNKWIEFKGKISDITKSVQAAYKGWVSEKSKAAWATFRSKITNITKSVQAKFGGWIAGAKKKWDNFKKSLKDKTVTITIGLKNLLVSAWNAVARKVKAARGKSAFAKRILPDMPILAKGGYLNKGQMFIAREAGPEMVGRIGNKSAVANNAQIEGAIARSVATANVTQNMLLRQLINAVNNSGNGNGTAEIKLVVDGQQLGKAAIKNINKVQRQQGRTLLEV